MSVYTQGRVNPVLEDIYRTGKCVDLAGKERKVTGAVPREDALILQGMVRFVKAKTAGLGYRAKPRAVSRGRAAASRVEG
jgi:hypothetical protein